MKHPQLSARGRGVALILVLAFLVLISGLVLAFYSSVQTEFASAKAYANGANTKQLADATVQLVTGSIRSATSNGAGVAWASQPGMIRTYGKDSDTASSDPLAYYKLYSSDNMVVTATQAASFVPGEDAPAGWDARPACFTDLNAPVVSGNNTRQYPIIDPAALPDGAYPVDGFKVENAPVAASGNATVNIIPMPVRWMYILRDGTLTTPKADDNSGASNIASFQSVPIYKQPSRQNPIVGRIAFWTDDETCKLNVNTASEPTPWDTPRAVTIQDLNYGRYQPANKEFQRYPGHPFMNALSPVLFPNPSGTTLSDSVRLAQAEQIAKLVPRVAWGGSKGGKTQITNSSSASDITLDQDRLFASVDEFLFDPTRSVPSSPTDLATKLPYARFFLTANSRAPEVNLFNLPRVSLWPENKDPANRTAFDKLAAFCSTIGAAPDKTYAYYFDRSLASDPAADYTGSTRNQQLYKYLQALTGSSMPIPGYGGSFKDKWGDDRDQVLTEIFDYIRCVNLKDPQQNATPFAAKGQVAPIFIQSNNTQGFGRFHTISQAGFHFICSQDGKFGSPENDPNVKTGERTIEAAFIFSPFCPGAGWYQLQEQVFYDVSFTTPFTINGQDLKMQSGTGTLNDSIGQGEHGRRMGGSGGIRMPISAFGGGGYRFVSTASPRVKITDPNQPMQFSGGKVVIKIYAGTTAGKLIQTVNLTFPSGKFPAPKLAPTTVKSDNPRYSEAPYYDPGTDPDPKYNSSKLVGTEAYRDCSATKAPVWWTIKGRYAGVGAMPHQPGAEYTDPARRFIAQGANPPGFKQGGVFRAEDVVRTIVPDHGDFRLIAAQHEVSSDQFVPVRTGAAGWDDSSESGRMQHIFSSPTGTHHLFGFCNEPGVSTTPSVIPPTTAADQFFGGFTNGPTLKYHYSRLPEIRPGAGQLYNWWNDYDNGVAQWMDGPMINKPDEGNQSATNSPYTYFAWNFTESQSVFFSPSRLVPSAGMLGSLPTGVKRNKPWQTLLFRPEVRKHDGKPHPGAVSPMDHLIMDLFWMPVVEPYAISEPFSTAGKVNLNYQIVPFTYIRRATALHGAFKSEEPLVLANAGSNVYKLWDHETNDHPLLPNSKDTNPQVSGDWNKLYNGQAPFDKLRRAIDPDKTLKQADDKFAQGEIFRSATQICELHLVRKDENLSDYTSGKIWDEALPTGDNTRERPYVNLYAKLTTKSNTYTVHFRVQTLKKRLGTGSSDTDPRWLQWDESKDAVLGDYRGSTLIERYIDPADPRFKSMDFATDPSMSLDAFYKFRILSTKKFGA